jgi:hypothetical protein
MSNLLCGMSKKTREWPEEKAMSSNAVTPISNELFPFLATESRSRENGNSHAIALVLAKGQGRPVREVQNGPSSPIFFPYLFSRLCIS